MLRTHNASAFLCGALRPLNRIQHPRPHRISQQNQPESTQLSTFSKPKNSSAIIQTLGLVAQSVEQRIENPCVGGSIPPRATIHKPRVTVSRR